MTQGELSVLLAAIEEVNARVGRVEGKVDNLPTAFEERFKPLEEDLQQRKGAEAARVGIARISQGTVALLLSLGSLVVVAFAILDHLT